MSMTSSLLLRPDLSSKIHPEQPEQEQDFTFLGIDHFDRLPDSLLLLVFNKIGDVKALGRCCVVSRLDNVVVRVDCVISDDDSSSSAINSSSISSSSDKSRNPFSNLFHFVISQFLCPKRPSGSSNGSSALLLSEDGEVERGGVTHHSPTQVLKNFNEIRFLKKKKSG
ncbi:F-box protein At5g46170-like [Fagus crenata]